MLAKIYFVVLGLIAIAAGGFWWFSQRQPVVAPTPVTERTDSVLPRTTPAGTAAAPVDGEIALADALHHERWRDAVDILERWRVADRTDAELLSLQVELALRTGRVATARAAWTSLAALPERDAAVAALEGLVLMAEGREMEARDKALRLSWATLTQEQAELVAKTWIALLADRDLAAERWNDVLAMIPSEQAARVPSLFDRRQAALLSLGRVEEGRTLLRQVAHRMDQSRQHLAEGDLEQAAGRLEEAEDWWRKSLGDGDRVPEAPLLVAVAERARQSGRPLLLADMLEQLLNQGGVQGPLRLWEAGTAASARLDRMDLALRISKEVSRMRPGDPAWINNRVWCESLAELPTAGSLEALAALETRFPQVPEFPVTRALAAWRLGNLDLAENSLRSAEQARQQINREAGATEVLIRYLVACDRGQAEVAATWQARLNLEALVPAERRLLD